MNTNLMFSSQTHNWSTPKELFKKLDEEFKFTLDVCADTSNYKCKKYFTEKENGLIQDWSKDVCFMNPPFGRSIKDWVIKAAKEASNGATVVALLPARTDTKWFNEYILPNSQIVEDSLLAWAAGVIDGEGCIFVRKDGKKGVNRNIAYDLGIKVTMTDFTTIKKLESIFGIGHFTEYVKNNKDWKNALSWVCRSRKAEEVIKKILPYLVTKKEQAILALEFQKTFDDRIGASSTTIDIINKREELYLKIKNLKSEQSACIKENKYTTSVRFIKGRLKFSGCKTSAPFPSMIVVFNPVKEYKILKQAA